MALPQRSLTPPKPEVRDVDPRWAERLAAEAERFERGQRRLARRRALLCAGLAVGVVVGGVAGFLYETDTRWATVKLRPSLGYVRVTPLR